MVDYQNQYPYKLVANLSLFGKHNNYNKLHNYSILLYIVSFLRKAAEII